MNNGEGTLKPDRNKPLKLFEIKKQINTFQSFNNIL